jgi:formylglycine-generating enzyme required for sulfatase activity
MLRKKLQEILAIAAAAVMLLSLFSCTSQADKTHTNSIEMEFVLIPAGSFNQGKGIQEGSPGHKVTISKLFYLGKYEVTQEQWYTIMGNASPTGAGVKGTGMRVNFPCWRLRRGGWNGQNHPRQSI